MVRLIVNLFSDECGATAVEYGLVASLISMAAIVGFTAYGASFSSMFQSVSESIDRALTPGG